MRIKICLNKRKKLSESRVCIQNCCRRNLNKSLKRYFTVEPRDRNKDWRSASAFLEYSKGTLVKKMLSKHPELFELSVSLTTRNPRQG